MNPNFVSDIFPATKRGTSPLKGRRGPETSDRIDYDKEEFHKRLMNSLYVKLIGKSVFYKRLAEQYGPNFIKLRDKIERDEKGNVKSHKIFLKQVSGNKKLNGKPWSNWVDVNGPGLSIQLMLSQGSGPKLQTF